MGRDDEPVGAPVVVVVAGGQSYTVERLTVQYVGPRMEVDNNKRMIFADVKVLFTNTVQVPGRFFLGGGFVGGCGGNYNAFVHTKANTATSSVVTRKSRTDGDAFRCPGPVRHHR